MHKHIRVIICTLYIIKYIGITQENIQVLSLKQMNTEHSCVSSPSQTANKHFLCRLRHVKTQCCKSEDKNWVSVSHRPLVVKYFSMFMLNRAFRCATKKKSLCGSWRFGHLDIPLSKWLVCMTSNPKPARALCTLPHLGNFKGVSDSFRDYVIVIYRGE